LLPKAALKLHLTTWKETMYLKGKNKTFILNFERERKLGSLSLTLHKADSYLFKYTYFSFSSSELPYLVVFNNITIYMKEPRVQKKQQN
jgi:hypothetical protein